MTTKGTTEILTGDNLKTFIYEQHYEREIATGSIAGTGSQEFSTTHKMEACLGDTTTLSGWSGSPQTQYVDSDGNYFRKDVFIETLKSGTISPLNTATYPTSIVIGTTGSFVVTGSLPASVAGSLLVSYSASLNERTDEITNVTIGGGGRANTYIVVQNGTRVKVTSVQESRTVSIEAISLEQGWVAYLNGEDVSQSIDNTSSGSDLLNGSVGAQTRDNAKTIIVRQNDPRTGNQVLDAFFNVDQVSNDTARPSEGQATETAAFDCEPQDYCRISILNEQG